MGKNYVEWGHYKKNKKIKNFLVTGSDAYDLWHLAVRLKEVLNLRKLLEKKNSISKLPRKEKFLMLYLFFLVNKPNKIIELGCSTMEIIDGLEACEKIYKNIFTKKIKKIIFSGIESSELLRSCSLNIHKKKIEIFKSTREYLKKNYTERKTLFHDFGVSNYAFINSNDFISFLNRFGSGYFKITFSLQNTFSINPRGKKLTFFSIKDMTKLNKPLYYLFNDNKIKNWTILKDDKTLRKKTLTGFFYYGNLKNFNFIKKKLKIKSFFNKVGINPIKIN